MAHTFALDISLVISTLNGPTLIKRIVTLFILAPSRYRSNVGLSSFILYAIDVARWGLHSSNLILAFDLHLKPLIYGHL